MDKDNLEIIKNNIYTADFKDVVKYLRNEKNWSTKDIEFFFEQYKNYLFLLAKYKRNDMPPSYEINNVWSAHILVDLNKYYTFCKSIFNDESMHLADHKNYFINNNFINPIDKINFKNITKEFYYKEYGEKLYTRSTSRIIQYIKEYHKAIVIGLLPVTFLSVFSFISYRNDIILQTHKSIEDATRDLTFDEEIMNMVCNKELIDMANPSYLKISYDITKERWAHFFSYTKLVRDAYERHLISDELFNDLSSYGHMQNGFFKYGFNICKATLRSDKQIDSTRKELTRMILKSEKEMEYPTIFKASNENMISEIEHLGK